MLGRQPCPHPAQLSPTATLHGSTVRLLHAARGYQQQIMGAKTSRTVTLSRHCPSPQRTCCAPLPPSTAPAQEPPGTSASWLSCCCLCSYTVQPVLLALASSQHRSRTWVPLHHLIHQQIRPTCPAQTPISPTHMLSPSMCRWPKQRDPWHNPGRRQEDRNSQSDSGQCPPVLAPATPSLPRLLPGHLSKPQGTELCSHIPQAVGRGGANGAAPVGSARKGAAGSRGSSGCRWGPADVCQ